MNRTAWIALAAGVILPVAGLAGIAAAARAPDQHTGRILVVFADAPGDTVAYGRLAAAGATPIRVMGSVEGWIAETDAPGAVAALRESGTVSYVFRDVGLGRALAGCLGLASGPARPHGIIP